MNTEPSINPNLRTLVLGLLALLTGVLALSVYLQAIASDEETVYTKAIHRNSPAPTAAVTIKKFSNLTFGFSFSYPSDVSVNQLATTLNNDKSGLQVLQVTAKDFTAKIYLAKTNVFGQSNGSYVIGNFRDNHLNDRTVVTKNVSFPAGNFSFSLLDVAANPTYVSAFADLDTRLIDVSFSSLNGEKENVNHTQTDLPKSAKDFLTSFTKLTM